ncbi:MAG: Secretion system C-terminal sorting domain [Bacteroidota bacterium]
MRKLNILMSVVAFSLPLFVLAQVPKKTKIVESETEGARETTCKYQAVSQNCLRPDGQIFIAANLKNEKSLTTYKVSFFSENNIEKNVISDLTLTFDPTDESLTIAHAKQNTVKEENNQYFFSPMQMKEGMNFTYSVETTDEGIYIKNTENTVLCTQVFKKDCPNTVNLNNSFAKASSVSTLSLAPNPASSQLRLNYNLEEASAVQGSIIDIYGRVLQTFGSSEQQSTGRHENILDISPLIDGLYYVVLKKQHNLSTEQIEFLVQR